MKKINRIHLLWALLATSALVASVSLMLGVWKRQWPPIAAGALGLSFVTVRGTRRWQRAANERAGLPDRRTGLRDRRAAAAAAAHEADERADEPVSLEPDVGQPANLTELVEQMFNQGRYALLLRPQIASQLSQHQIDRAAEALESEMALVPDGEVVVEGFDAGFDEDLDPIESNMPHGSVIDVQRVFLDRYPVTNRQYLHFVKSGGYTQMALWDPEVWPAMLDFVDETGHSGPRFWKHGRYSRGDDDHPVTGVSWFEAAAYARWAGKRLATDAEWVKAGSWPVVLSSTTRLQRRYPWGDSMERNRANLWGSGPGQPCSVLDFADGVSVGGIHQLIGNVWEWTSGEFAPDEVAAGEIALGTSMRSLRGGAFDTYFDNHATCQFATGDNPVVRKHNIGFRCGLSVCDLSIFQPVGVANQCASASDARAADDLSNEPVCEEVTS